SWAHKAGYRLSCRLRAAFQRTSTSTALDGVACRLHSRGTLIHVMRLMTVRWRSGMRLRDLHRSSGLGCAARHQRQRNAWQDCAKQQRNNNVMEKLRRILKAMYTRYVVL